MPESQGRRWASRRVLLVSLWLTLLLLAVKIWMSWVTQSLSLVSESLHTLIDSFSLLLSLMAVASPSMAERAVWGHGKRETTMALLLTAFMGFTCLSLLAIALQQLQAVIADSTTLLPIQSTLPLLQGLSVVMATNFCLAFFKRYEAEVFDSNALRLSAYHGFQDAWLMLMVALGWVGVWRGYTWIDPLLTLGIVVMAIAACWRVLNQQLPLLMQPMAIAPEALAETIHQVEGITHCYGIRSRGVVGRQVVVEMHLILHPECVDVARQLAIRVERAIRERYGAARVVIYIERDRPLANQ